MYDMEGLIDYAVSGQDPGRVIHACCEDMIRLWTDPTIRRLLSSQNIRLQDMGGL